ncbi:hypothetical protein C8Q80DRAFT_1102575, partial [Daedaleopsis nitida]
LYDWALTLDREVSLVWQCKLNGAAIVFLLNRYLFLLRIPVNNVFSTPISTNVSPPQCYIRPWTSH